MYKLAVRIIGNMNSLVLMIGTYPEFDAQGEMVDNEKEIIKSRYGSS